MNKIFISHSHKDWEIAEKIVDLFEIIGVPSKSIFCSSLSNYGISLGKDYLKNLKEELSGDIIAVFILTSNFYKSPISLCEMGASWVLTKKHIPILIPPFEFRNIKGVFPNIIGMKINDKTKLNELKELIENHFKIEIPYPIWERKRNNTITEINKILTKNQLQL